MPASQNLILKWKDKNTEQYKYSYIKSVFSRIDIFCLNYNLSVVTYKVLSFKPNIRNPSKNLKTSNILFWIEKEQDLLYVNKI